MILLFQLKRGSGGIGRRTRLRIWRLTAWGFKSLLPHQLYCTYCTFRGVFFLPKLSINVDIYIDKHIHFDRKIGTDLTTTLYVIINELELFN